VADQLRSAGVRADRIHVAGLCTASHPDVLCSYRRDGSPAGRLAAAIVPTNGRSATG
jgi:copper oxidase (laccase) domain-containing protein